MSGSRSNRLALTILLFLGLGLVTSVAVAWGAHAHLMATETISMAGVTTNQWFGVSLYRGVSTTEQGVLTWRLPEDGRPPSWSNLRHPPLDRHTRITVLESGWPWQCLGYELERDASDRQALDLGQRGAIVGSLELSRLRQDWKDVHRLPYFVNPLQMIANTLFWVLAWLAFFCLPSLWRINQWYLLKPQRYCAWCGFDLKHATGHLCTECGKDQSRRPPLVSKPAASLALLILLIGSIGIAGLANVFIMKRKIEPIHAASYLGDIESVRREIASGADVNIQTLGHVRAGATPLTLAVIGNRPEVTELLLQNGASFMWRDTLSVAPELAAQNGHAAILRSMIHHGLDVNLPSVNGKTLMERAVAQDNFDVVEILFKAGADDVIVFSSGDTLFHYVVKQGTYEIVQELLERDHDVNRVGAHGQTPLMYASGRKVRFIREDLSENDVMGVEENTKEIAELVRLLIEHGAEVNAKDNRDMTPLHHAASRHNGQVVKLLLDSGADARAVADDGRAGVLHYACGWGDTPRGKLERDYRLRVVQQLVEAGADVNGVPGQYDSPLAGVIWSHRADVIKWLLIQGATPDFSALEAAVGIENSELLADLIERGGDVLERNSDGDTLLSARPWGLSAQGRVALIKAGVDVNAVNKNGETALMRATEIRNVRYVQFLLEHGADPTIKQPDGRAALDMTNRLKIKILLEEAIEKWEAEHVDEDVLSAKP